jgi:hypothetical protein
MMRAHSITNQTTQKPTLRRLLWGFVVVPLLLGGCDPGWHSEGPNGASSGPGQNKLAIRWTQSGLTLTESRCAAMGIGSMDVYLLRPSDQAVLAVWSNVVCGLDRYSMAELPSGQVVVHVEAIQKPGTSARKCVPYLGEALAKTSLEYSDPPVTVALSAYSTCQ